MYHILLDCLRNTITHELSLSWGTNLQRHEKKNHQAKSKHLGRQTLDPSGTAIVTSSVRDLIMVNEIYDPCHIDADWSGWVALRTSRWHPTSPTTAMKVSVTTNETGFGPNREAETTEWSKPSRKLVTHSLGSKSSTFSLIGGPVSADDLDDACRWESEASAAKYSPDPYACVVRRFGSKPILQMLSIFFCTFSEVTAAGFRRENRE